MFEVGIKCVCDKCGRIDWEKSLNDAKTNGWFIAEIPNNSIMNDEAVLCSLCAREYKDMMKKWISKFQKRK